MAEVARVEVAENGYLVKLQHVRRVSELDGFPGVEAFKRQARHPMMPAPEPWQQQADEDDPVILVSSVQVCRAVDAVLALVQGALSEPHKSGVIAGELTNHDDLGLESFSVARLAEVGTDRIVGYRLVHTEAEKRTRSPLAVGQGMPGGPFLQAILGQLGSQARSRVQVFEHRHELVAALSSALRDSGPALQARIRASLEETRDLTPAERIALHEASEGVEP